MTHNKMTRKLGWTSLQHRVECDCAALKSRRLSDLRRDVARVLTTRQRQVVTGRWGLEAVEPQTLDQVGRNLGVSYERIRQIEARAVMLLKTESDIRHGIRQVPDCPECPACGSEYGSKTGICWNCRASDYTE